MTTFTVIARDEYEVDENGTEIPGTRITRYCVKNTVARKILKCYPTFKQAKDVCDEENRKAAEKKRKPKI